MSYKDLIKQEAIIKGLQEAARVVVLAVLPILVTGLQNGYVDWNVVLVAAGIAVLKFIDKYLHSIADEDGWLKLQGLTGF